MLWCRFPRGNAGSAAAELLWQGAGGEPANMVEETIIMKADLDRDLALLDRPEVSRALFHPRKERLSSGGRGSVHMIPVGQRVSVGARFHLAGPSALNLLFFHGNGEIAADYEDVGPIYNRIGINLLVSDYRGYGLSEGSPTVSSMLKDSHRILDYARTWLAANGHHGPLVVMGRSLGSGPALELAAFGDHIDGLIIESGFASAVPLLRLLGLEVERIGFGKDTVFRNTDKIGAFKGPTLIIHARQDRIIPCADGEALYAASGAARKKMVRIDGAGHNDLFFVGMEPYLQAVAELARDLVEPVPAR
jgi:hypothetical protein